MQNKEYIYIYMYTALEEFFQPPLHSALQGVSSCLVHVLYQSSVLASSAIGYLQITTLVWKHPPYEYLT